MLHDITLKITKELQEKAPKSQLLAGHLGTHFDVMNKQFPLSYTRRSGYIFDITAFENQEVTINDIDLSKVKEDMFVGFYSACLDKYGYGSTLYHDLPPVLANELIEKLIEKRVSIIGIDFMGVRKGKEHTPADQYCADHEVFVIENLCNMQQVAEKEGLVFYTLPVSFEGTTGLPCRVVVEDNN